MIDTEDYLSPDEQRRVFDKIGDGRWENSTFFPLEENWFHLRINDDPVGGRREWWVHFVGAYPEIHNDEPDFLEKTRGPGRPAMVDPEVEVHPEQETPTGDDLERLEAEEELGGI